MAIRRVSQAQEIEASLEKRLQSVRKTDGRLPAESDLAAEFGVSRVTIREALASLERRGLILRRQGLGTFVNRSALDLQIRLDESVEFGQLIQSAGYEAGLPFCECQVGIAPDAIAERLLIEPNAPVLIIRKVFTASDTPVIYCLNVVSLDLAAPDRHPEIIRRAQSPIPVYSLLARSFGRNVSYHLSEVGASTADAEVAKALGIDACGPLFTIEEVGYAEDQQPLFYGLSYYVPGLIHFKLVRKPIFADAESA